MHINKIKLKFIQNSQNIVKKNRLEDFTFTKFKIYYKATEIKDSMVLLKEYKDQQNRTANPEIHPYKYSQLIFDKGIKVIQNKFIFQKSLE